MEPNNNEGLILKINPENHSLIVLDKDRGKIYCKINKKNNFRYFTGLFIRYDIKPYRSEFKLNNIEYEFGFTNLNTYELSFLHLLIELCIILLPTNQENTIIFDFIKDIIANRDIIKTATLKKIVLCQLFFKLALDHEEAIQNSKLHRIMQLPIDTLIDIEIDLSNNRILDNWIREVVTFSKTKIKSIRFFEF